MRIRQQGTGCAAVVLLAALSNGCAVAPNESRDVRAAQDTAELEGQLEDLRLQVQELQDRNAIRAERLKELERRNRRLTDLVRDLQFDKELLEKHVEALAPAPKQRDRLEAECRQLREENEQIRREILRLRERLGLPTQPATGPAAGEP
jgi:chromosome segregation ATPase